MSRTLPLCILTALCLLPVAHAAAQDADDPLPTLDELLGTDTGAEQDTVTDLPETQEEELERLLSGQEIVDEFRAAADLMDRSARRLAAAHDTGLTTQRLQQDVLQKLDKLIDDAQRRSQQSSSSASSSSQQQQNQEQSQPRRNQNSQSSSGDNRTEQTPPGLQTGPLGPEQVADLAAWGDLPERFRDALLQGATDRFSATYRKLTEAYYRSLAEDPEE